MMTVLLVDFGPLPLLRPPGDSFVDLLKCFHLKRGASPAGCQSQRWWSIDKFVWLVGKRTMWTWTRVIGREAFFLIGLYPAYLVGLCLVHLVELWLICPVHLVGFCTFEEKKSLQTFPPAFLFGPLFQIIGWIGGLGNFFWFDSV